MASADGRPEHFVTLFDNTFLPMGMALHQSLMQHSQPFHLWIVCMDELVETNLKALSLPNVTILPVNEIENSELKKVKPERTKGEYCWTITPFTPQAVFNRDAAIERVTYLDADLFFFDTPQILLKELKKSRKQVLITEHAYAPEYDKTSLSGRFCVQFMTFQRTPEAQKVMTWWQDRCLEWCYNRFEEGKFGDQKYLDNWPDIFSDEVHVLEQSHKTLAPWNVLHFEKQSELNPVFYHFHNCRIISTKKIQLYIDYRIGKKGLKLYNSYTDSIRNARCLLQTHKISFPCSQYQKQRWALLRYIKKKIERVIRFSTI